MNSTMSPSVASEIDTVGKGRTYKVARGGPCGIPTSLTHPDVLWVTVLFQMQRVLPCCASFSRGSWQTTFSGKNNQKSWAPGRLGLGAAAIQSGLGKPAAHSLETLKPQGSCLFLPCTGKGAWQGQASGVTGSWFGVHSPSWHQGSWLSVQATQNGTSGPFSDVFAHSIRVLLCL